MTKELFLQRHGAAWEILLRDPMMTDLQSLANDLSPHRQSCKVGIEISSDNAQYILGTIAGYSSLAELIFTQLSIPANMTPPEAVYEEKQL